MTAMGALRNRRFRRFVAAGLAVTWLFTVLACAMEGDLAESAQATQLAADLHTDPSHQHGGSQDDDCCQLQAGSIPSFNVVKLPNVIALPAIVSLIFLLVLTLPTALLRVGMATDEHVLRRRFDFLAHSLQAQAPPAN